MNDSSLLLTFVVIFALGFAIVAIFLIWDSGSSPPPRKPTAAPPGPARRPSTGPPRPGRKVTADSLVRTPARGAAQRGTSQSGLGVIRPIRNESRRAQSLRDVLRHFEMDDLRELCFRLDIDPDALPGQGEPSKARELVIRCRRDGRLDELTEVTLALRPELADQIGG